MNELVTVQEKEIMCDGAADGEASAHPSVFLHVQNDNQIKCPYCGKIFIYENKF